MSARDPLAGVWDRADAAEARFTADEVSSWPEGREALLTEARIIRRDDNTATVICDACADGHVEEVERIEQPPGSPVRAYIHCPEAGRVPVALDRLNQWVVDFDGIAEAVARALGLAGEVEEVVPTRLWSLGTLRSAGRAREIFFARGATWMDASAVFGRCERLTASRGALLLVSGGLPATDAWADVPTAIGLKVAARFEDGHFAIERDRIEDLLVAAAADSPHRQRRQPVSGSQSGGRPVLTADQASRRLLTAMTRLRANHEVTERLTNVALGKADGVNADTISNWLACAGWSLEDLDVEWARRRRKKPE